MPIVQKPFFFKSTSKALSLSLLPSTPSWFRRLETETNSMASYGRSAFKSYRSQSTMPIRPGLPMWRIARLVESASGFWPIF